MAQIINETQPPDLPNNSRKGMRASDINPVQNTDRKLSVLVVDDSAVVRQVMTSILCGGDMNVIVAADPLIALNKLKQARPDVIVLDLEMPRMDGMTFLRKIMAEDPFPVVVCSGQAGKGTALALRALEEGAVDILAKPALGVRGFLEDSATILIDTIRGAARARLPRHPQPARPILRPPQIRMDGRERKLIAMGASTGGTEALRLLLEAMPDSAPGIVIVQHMPEAYTAAFARRLNESCRIEVKEAINGDSILPGLALIAPGNRHMMVSKTRTGYQAQIKDGPLISRHRPSVNALFRSCARAAGSDAIGVILTGMGDDGAEGLLEMRRAGAATIAQDEASCVVFGMPKEAIKRRAASEVVALAEMPQALLKRFTQPS
jgi:two-component system, chemotaxis family, protein-glutamate methylesterase/glutaminase